MDNESAEIWVFCCYCEGCGDEAIQKLWIAARNKKRFTHNDD